MISLKQIQYALAVEKTRHFKKAAEHCSITQSALSTAISEMESQLNVQIFERNPKKVLVTAVGQEILDKARAIQTDVAELYEIAKGQKKPLSTPMSLGVIPTIAPYLLPRVLPTLRKSWPDFRLNIFEDQSHALVESVRQGELDVAILALPYPVNGLHVFEFWQEDFYIVTHRDDPLGKLKKVGSDDIASSRLLLLKEGHCLKDHALAACHLSLHNDESALLGTSLTTLIEMVAGEMGVTFVPEIALPRLIREKSEFRIVALSEPGPHRRLAFICRLNYNAVNDIEVLMKIFRKNLKTRLRS